MITTFLDASQLPLRTQDQDTFDDLMASYMQRLPVWTAEVNATASVMNVNALGAPYAIPYMLVASNQGVGTAAGGKFANDGTTFYFDAKDLRGVSVLALLATFNASTSAIKGTAKVTAQNDPSRWVIYDITGYVQGPTGLYGSASVTFRVSSTGGANYPLQINEPVLLTFQRSGDKGDTGSQATQWLNTLSVTTPVALLTWYNLFSTNYDKYVIELQNFTLATAGMIAMGFANNGTVDTGANYFPMVADGASGTAATTNIVLAGTVGVTPQALMNMTIELTNTNSPSPNAKGITQRGIASNIGYSRNGRYTGGPLTGFSLFTSSGANINSGTVRIFGIKNN